MYKICSGWITRPKHNNCHPERSRGIFLGVDKMIEFEEFKLQLDEISEKISELGVSL